MKFIYFIVDATIITLVVMSIQKKKNVINLIVILVFIFFMRRWAPNSLIELGHGHYTSNQK